MLWFMFIAFSDETDQLQTFDINKRNFSNTKLIPQLRLATEKNDNSDYKDRYILEMKNIDDGEIIETVPIRPGSFLTQVGDDGSQWIVERNDNFDFSVRDKKIFCNGLLLYDLTDERYLNVSITEDGIPAFEQLHPCTGNEGKLVGVQRSDLLAFGDRGLDGFLGGNEARFSVYDDDEFHKRAYWSCGHSKGSWSLGLCPEAFDAKSGKCVDTLKVVRKPHSVCDDAPQGFEFIDFDGNLPRGWFWRCAAGIGTAEAVRCDDDEYFDGNGCVRAGPCFTKPIGSRVALEHSTGSYGLCADQHRDGEKFRKGSPVEIACDRGLDSVTRTNCIDEQCFGRAVGEHLIFFDNVHVRVPIGSVECSGGGSTLRQLQDRRPKKHRALVEISFNSRKNRSVSEESYEEARTIYFANERRRRSLLKFDSVTGSSFIRPIIEEATTAETSTVQMSKFDFKTIASLAFELPVEFFLDGKFIPLNDLREIVKFSPFGRVALESPCDRFDMLSRGSLTFSREFGLTVCRPFSAAALWSNPFDRLKLFQRGEEVARAVDGSEGPWFSFDGTLALQLVRDCFVDMENPLSVTITDREFRVGNILLEKIELIDEQQQQQQKFSKLSRNDVVVFGAVINVNGHLFLDGERYYGLDPANFAGIDRDNHFSILTRYLSSDSPIRPPAGFVFVYTGFYSPLWRRNSCGVFTGKVLGSEKNTNSRFKSFIYNMSEL